MGTSSRFDRSEIQRDKSSHYDGLINYSQIDQSQYATNPCVNNTQILPSATMNMNDSQRLTQNSNILNQSSSKLMYGAKRVSQPIPGSKRLSRRNNSYIFNNNSIFEEIQQDENEESPDFRQRRKKSGGHSIKLRQARSTEHSTSDKKAEEMVKHTRHHSIFVTNQAAPLIGDTKPGHKRQRTSLASELGRDQSLKYVQKQIRQTYMPVRTLYENNDGTRSNSYGFQATPNHHDYQNAFYHVEMNDEQKSYIDLNYTNNYSNIELTNAKMPLRAYGFKGSTERKSNAIPLSPLTRHITDQKMGGLEVILSAERDQNY